MFPKHPPGEEGEEEAETADPVIRTDSAAGSVKCVIFPRHSPNLLWMKLLAKTGGPRWKIFSMSPSHRPSALNSHVLFSHGVIEKSLRLSKDIWHSVHCRPVVFYHVSRVFEPVLQVRVTSERRERHTLQAQKSIGRQKTKPHSLPSHQFSRSIITGGTGLFQSCDGKKIFASRGRLVFNLQRADQLCIHRKQKEKTCEATGYVMGY